MNALPDFPENLWTVDDVARFARCSKSWIYKAAERGEVPCLRVGSMLRFEPNVVRRFFTVACVPEAASAT